MMTLHVHVKYSHLKAEMWSLHIMVFNIPYLLTILSEKFMTLLISPRTISIWQHWRPSWISDLKDFDLQVVMILPTKFRVSLSVQEKKFKINLQDGGNGSHLGFPIGSILPIFYLQVAPILPPKFQSI